MSATSLSVETASTFSNGSGLSMTSSEQTYQDEDSIRLRLRKLVEEANAPVNTYSCDLQTLIHYVIENPESGIEDYLWGYIRLEVPAAVFLSAVIATFRQMLAANRLPSGRDVESALFLGTRVHYWMTHYWRPCADSDIEDALEAFIVNHIAPVFPDLSFGMKIALEKISQRPRSVHSSTLYTLHSEVPQWLPMIRTRFVYDAPYLIDLATPSGTEEFSRQLTLVLSTEFRRMEPWNLVRAWNGRMSKRVEEKPEVSYTALVLALKVWVAESIIYASDEHAVIKLYEMWRCVAQQCFDIRDFDASAAITQILGGIQVRNRYLKAPYHHDTPIRAWRRKMVAMFPGHAMRTINSGHEIWQGITSSHDERYRAMLGSEAVPTVPYLELHMNTVVNAGSVLDSVPVSRSADGSALFSIDALQKMAQETYALEKMHKPYPFRRDERMCQWIWKMLTQPYHPINISVVQ